MKNTFSSHSRKFLTTDEIKKILNTLEPLTVRERIINHRLKIERADVIIPATKIFIGLMDYCEISRVYVPGGGLSDGLILQLHKKQLMLNV